MNHNTGTQLDLLKENRPTDGEAPSLFLLIELDQRSWLRFLNEEWLLPTNGIFVLGLENIFTSHGEDTTTKVVVAFDYKKLPSLCIHTWRDEQLIETSVEDLSSNDSIVFWNAPLPLFAVDHFLVNNERDKAHMSALVRSFADIEPPSQPIKVGYLTKAPLPAYPRTIFAPVFPPDQWDSLRGAIAMAFEAVPPIRPWIQLLSDTLNSIPCNNLAKYLEAPWLCPPIWTKDYAAIHPSSALWRAIIDELSRPGIRKDWKPRAILTSICMRALDLGEPEASIAKLTESTVLLLQDRVTIRDIGLMSNNLHLALQLVLLRPKPERFFEWKNAWPEIPPAAWLSGAILSGYITGFRALPPFLRGSFEARKFGALQSWKLTSTSDLNGWNELYRSPLNWSIYNDCAVFECGKKVVTEHKLNNRGRWYEADLLASKNREAAESLAKKYCPSALTQTLVLEEGEYEIFPSDHSTVAISNFKLTVSGALEIALTTPIKLKEKIDSQVFRHWIATGSISNDIPRPEISTATAGVLESNLFDHTALEKPVKSKKNDKTKSRNDVEAPKGLMIVPDFITQNEESTLIRIIDSSPWDASMNRRVQHYGWRYDYKAKKVDNASYIGALPEWAAALGKRLWTQGLIAEMPDQVIVNEYLRGQGITKHIDCPSCFRGAIITISLNESWEMVFTRKTKSSSEEKFKVVLPRRSATIIDGEARSVWQHEIPKRLTEAGIPRGRRVSVTFRKVDL